MTASIPAFRLARLEVMIVYVLTFVSIDLFSCDIPIKFHTPQQMYM
jgi:hypothetical protein